MTITQLKYVLAVAEHKNFTLAAEKCFVTQPTLSMQIQKIEEVHNFESLSDPYGDRVIKWLPLPPNRPLSLQ